MFYMTNKLGAWQVGDDSDKGKAAFKLFFPKGVDPEIASIRVAGSFQKQISAYCDWDFPNGFPMQRMDTSDGIFWSYETDEELAAGYYEYKYLVSFNGGEERKVSDPCTRYGGKDKNNLNAAFVIGGSRPSENVVRDLGNSRKHLRDLILYEMNIDDFTAGYRKDRAPLDAVCDKLDDLKSLGFNAILFMPWTAWKYPDYDWGYEPIHYFAVEYRYANDLSAPWEKLSKLKALISACHDRDIHVIMDGVFNHVSREFPYKKFYRYEDTCPYTGQYGGMFTGLQDLNFNNDCTNEFIRDVCLYWINIFNIDGIRFDNTVNFYVAGDTKGLKKLIHTINHHTANLNKQNFSLTLEHLQEDAIEVTKNTNATSYWDNGFYGCTFQYLWWNQIDSKLLNKLNNQRFLDSAQRVPTLYSSNHDHSHMTWQAGARDNMGAMKWYKTQPYVIALYTSPATPMVQNGQEFGEDHWIPENDEGTGRRIVPRALQWKMRNDKIGLALASLYKRMGEIRNQHPGLRSQNFAPQPWEEWQTQFNPEGYGIDTSRQVAIYRRWGNDDSGREQQFVIVLNFSDSEQEVDVPFPADKEWTDLLSNYSGSWDVCVPEYRRLRLRIGSNWGHVFFKAF